MTNANNEPRSQGPVRVGVIASDERLAAIAAAVETCLLIHPLGQAGMPPAEGLREVPWVDDPRQLIGQPGLEAVLLANSTRVDAELAALAAERGLHVWRLPPVARTFAQATELVTRLRRLPTVYRVASWWEYVADHVWHELKWPADYQPLFSELRVSARGPKAGAWPTVPAEALGGALAHDGYALLEALVAARGLPDSVAAATGTYRRAGDGQTEDTAAAVLRYARGGAATVCVAWDLGAPETRLIHYGAALTVAVTDEEVTLTDLAGRVVDRQPLPGAYLASELLRFAELVRHHARDRATAPLERHLAASAVLEATYLSARTGHPESPVKFYRVQGWPEPQP